MGTKHHKCDLASAPATFLRCATNRSAREPVATGRIATGARFPRSNTAPGRFPVDAAYLAEERLVRVGLCLKLHVDCSATDALRLPSTRALVLKLVRNFSALVGGLCGLTVTSQAESECGLATPFPCESVDRTHTGHGKFRGSLASCQLARATQHEALELMVALGPRCRVIGARGMTTPCRTDKRAKMISMATFNRSGRGGGSLVRSCWEPAARIEHDMVIFRPHRRALCPGRAHEQGVA